MAGVFPLQRILRNLNLVPSQDAFLCAQRHPLRCAGPDCQTTACGSGVGGDTGFCVTWGAPRAVLGKRK